MSAWKMLTGCEGGLPHRDARAIRARRRCCGPFGRRQALAAHHALAGPVTRDAVLSERAAYRAMDLVRARRELRTRDGDSRRMSQANPRISREPFRRAFRPTRMFPRGWRPRQERMPTTNHPASGTGRALQTTGRLFPHGNHACGLPRPPSAALWRGKPLE